MPKFGCAQIWSYCIHLQPVVRCLLKRVGISGHQKVVWILAALHFVMFSWFLPWIFALIQIMLHLLSNSSLMSFFFSFYWKERNKDPWCTLLHQLNSWYHNFLFNTDHCFGLFRQSLVSYSGKVLDVEMLGMTWFIVGIHTMHVANSVGF